MQRRAGRLLALLAATGLCSLHVCSAQPAQLDDVLAAAAGSMDGDGDGQVTGAEFEAWAADQQRQLAVNEPALRAVATLAAGSANCRCVNPWRAGAIGSGRCRNFTSPSTGQPVCVPDDYGAARCAAWDADTGPSPCTPDSKEWWCKAWCYVNATDCLRPNDLIAYPFSPATLIGEPHYSYETCGKLDRYKQIRLTESLKGRNLRCVNTSNLLSSGRWDSPINHSDSLLDLCLQRFISR